MDPLSGLGLAANILQFIEFATEVVSKGNAIRKSTDGSIEGNAQLAAACSRMQSLAAALQRSSHASVTSNDIALDAICRDCSQIAAELHNKLQRLTLPGPRTRFKSYRQALKSVWTKDAIDALATRLELFRGELNTFMLAKLSQTVDTNAANQTTMLHALARGQELSTTTQQHVTRLEHDLTNKLIIEQQEKTRKMILEAMLRMAQWGMKTQFPDGFRIKYESSKRQAKRLAPLMIAENLAFSMLEDRFEAIPKAYQKTFEWAWQTDQHGSRPECKLAEWLQHGEGLYWISGKAGSGKSTFMKYLRNDPRAQQHLNIWAGSKSLVYGSFFFWKSGTALQKTQAGLLRSLLYCSLRQQPELVGAIFPRKLAELEQILTDHLYETQIDASAMSSVALPAKYRILMEDWSLDDLQEAFGLLIRQKVVDTKFCFMIDGIDEFDGEHSEIVKVLQDVADFDSVKICLSSRPLRVFERAFKACPGFRVQDLTEEDIRLYIFGNLHQHPDMIDLMRREGRRAGQLETMIVEKASGVFLWVQLVVKSLLHGLMNQDTIKDLERRLDLLPPDLEDLYRHMISKVDPLYRPRAYKFFHFAMKMSGEPLSLLLSLYDEEDPELPLTANIELMSVAQQEQRVNDINARLMTACAGLLEAHNPSCWEDARVQFMHRTVLDFFEKPDMQQELRKFSDDTPEQLDVSLIGALLLQLKWLLPPPAENCARFWELVARFLELASAFESNGAHIGTRLLDEFNRVATQHWESAFRGSPRSNKLTDETVHWTNWIAIEQNLGLENSLITHAIRYQLTSYISERYANDPRGLQAISSRPVLDVAIPRVQGHGFQPGPAPQLPCIAIIKTLLQAGADPNHIHQGQTPWQNALSQICNFRPDHRRPNPSSRLHWGQTWTQILKELLRFGADVHASVQVSSGLDQQSKSVGFIISVVLRQYDPIGAEELAGILIDKGVKPTELLQIPHDLESLHIQLNREHDQKNNLRVPFRLRSIGTKSGERLNLRGSWAGSS